MSKVVKIALAGEGGQGVQSIAQILAEAANADGKEAVYIPNFGVEQRGGVSIAFVQISDSDIGAPRFLKADILIPLSPRAIERTAQYVCQDTMYIYDNSLIEGKDVDKTIKDAKKIIPIPANDICKNELHPRVFNVMILGAVIAATKVLPMESIKNALEKNLKAKFEANPKLREMNFKALEQGYSYIEAKL